jgi:flagella basal body P-ring formation protein FlgA
MKNRFLFGVCWLIFVAWVFAAPVVALANPEEKIAAAIKNSVAAAYPEWAQSDIRVNFKYADRVFEGLRDMGEGVVFEIVDPREDFKPVGDVIFPIQAEDGNDCRKIFIRAEVGVFKNVVTAANRIPRGALIARDDLTLTERNVAALPQNYFVSFEAVLATEARTLIAKNSAIFDWMIKEVPLVRRGDEVSVLVKGANLLVRTEGVVLADGYYGKWLKVKVKGRDARESLEGRLISSGEVEVLLK